MLSAVKSRIRKANITQRVGISAANQPTKLAMFGISLRLRTVPRMLTAVDKLIKVHQLFCKADGCWGQSYEAFLHTMMEVSQQGLIEWHKAFRESIKLHKFFQRFSLPKKISVGFWSLV